MNLQKQKGVPPVLKKQKDAPPPDCLRDWRFWLVVIVSILFSGWLGINGGNCDYCWTAQVSGGRVDPLIEK